jgi:hypothetical protein
MNNYIPLIVQTEGWLPGHLTSQDNFRQTALLESQERGTILPKTELVSHSYPWDSSSDFTLNCQPPPLDLSPVVPGVTHERLLAVISRNRSPEQQSSMVLKRSLPAAHLASAELPLMLSPEQKVRLSLLEEKYAEERRKILLSHRSEKKPALQHIGLTQQVKKQSQSWMGSVWDRPTAGAGAGATSLLTAEEYNTAGWPLPEQQQKQQQLSPNPVNGFSHVAATSNNIYAVKSPRMPVNLTMCEVPEMGCAASLPSNARQESLGPDLGLSKQHVINAHRLLLPSQLEWNHLHHSQVEQRGLLHEQARWSRSSLSSSGTGAINWSTAGDFTPMSGCSGTFLLIGDEDHTLGRVSLSHPAVLTSRNSTAAAGDFQILRSKDFVNVNSSQLLNSPPFTMTPSKEQKESFQPPALRWVGKARHQGVLMHRSTLFDPYPAPCYMVVSETPPVSTSWPSHSRSASGTVHKHPEMVPSGQVQSMTIMPSSATEPLGLLSAWGRGAAAWRAELGLPNFFQKKPLLFPRLSQPTDRLVEVNPLSSPR